MSVMKLNKIKIWDDSFIGFFVGYVVVHFIFDEVAFFIEKFAEQNLLRKSECRITVRNFEMRIREYFSTAKFASTSNIFSSYSQFTGGKNV